MDFNGTLCDFYQDNSNKERLYLTRGQIGRALEYKDPQNAIDVIHNRHKDRLDRFSVTVKLSATDGKLYDTTVYTYKGAYEICRFSRQPNADAFFDFVWDVIEAIRTGKATLQPTSASQLNVAEVAAIAAQAASQTILQVLPDILKAVQPSTPQPTQIDDARLAMLPDVLSVRQVQIYLGVNIGRVYDIFGSDDFPAYKVGHKLYVSKANFIQWLTTLSRYGIFVG